MHARGLPFVLAVGNVVFATGVSGAEPEDGTSASAPTAPSVTGFVDLNGYYDLREFPVFTINTQLVLPRGFRYFSLVNYQSAPVNKTAELDSFYTEQHLDFTPVGSIPLALTALWTAASGDGNDSFRFGVLWRVSKTPGLERVFRRLHLSYSVDFHAVQLDALSGGYRSQIEHVYRLDVLPDVLDGRVYLAGFTDHNLWFGAPMGRRTSTVVSELQLGVRVVGGLHVIAEGRHNDNLMTEKTGLALGLEYLVPVGIAK